MNLQETLDLHVKAAVKALFNSELVSVEFQATRKEFAGDITVVVFPMLRVVKGNPVVIGEQIGQYLQDHVNLVKSFNVVKGFLNVEIDDTYYIDFFNTIKNNHNYGFAEVKDDKAVMVEYSSPNTNKPLHLGHVRNVLLGYAIAEILKAAGKNVYKTQIINDRGIHICKSMLAWQRFGNGETPEYKGLKGDKLVGNYYVEFEKVFQEEYSQWLKTIDAQNKWEEFHNKPETEKLLKEKYEEKFLNNEDLTSESHSEFRKSFKNEYFTNISKIGSEAQNMLRQWEAGNKEVVKLWETMNQWVYDGFEATYKAIGVDFDAYYYESQTYLLGKEFIAEGLKTDVFEKDPDGSVWCDLTADGLDRKIVLRADGTAVYMTQDIGTAIQRIKDYPDVGGMVYTVGNEQDYHFKVLFLILKKLGFEWAKNLYHLSYGMVDLPSGKMKSREGTVVDADDLIQEMADTAKYIADEKGKLDDYSEKEKKEIYQTIGLGALKYQILKVDPKKRILFDPKESIDFNGDSGPFVQMIYVRTRAILRKADFDYNCEFSLTNIYDKERELLKLIQLFPEVIQNAASNYNPSSIINYAYDLAKEYSSYYQIVPILGAEELDEKIFRVQLSKTVGQTIKNAFRLLGIDVPERM